MKDGPDIAAISALVGDPARANMLTALMNGQALTANELAREAGVAPQTASGHLARLLDGGMLTVEPQGRHRYYRLAGPDVATALEALMTLARQTPARRTQVGPRDPELRHARVCYDHLAGEQGVVLFARLNDLGIIGLSGGQVTVTARGEEQLVAFGIDMAALRLAKRPLCRTCIDWSERRPHLAGSLGAALLTRIVDLGWGRRLPGSRILRVSGAGKTGLATVFGAAG